MNSRDRSCACVGRQPDPISCWFTSPSQRLHWSVMVGTARLGRSRRVAAGRVLEGRTRRALFAAAVRTRGAQASRWDSPTCSWPARSRWCLYASVHAGLPCCSRTPPVLQSPAPATFVALQHSDQRALAATVGNRPAPPSRESSQHTCLRTRCARSASERRGRRYSRHSSSCTWDRRCSGWPRRACSQRSQAAVGRCCRSSSRRTRMHRQRRGGAKGAEASSSSAPSCDWRRRAARAARQPAGAPRPAYPLACGCMHGCMHPC